jgi:hypothetical protein
MTASDIDVQCLEAPTICSPVNMRLDERGIYVLDDPTKPWSFYPDHLWRISNCQHLLQNHLDWYCARCFKTKCQTIGEIDPRERMAVPLTFEPVQP